MNKVMKVLKHEPDDIVRVLDEACGWAEITHGRGAHYKTLFMEYFVEGKTTREHVLVYNELVDFIEIYRLWKEAIHRFPGLKEKIKGNFSTGPILREDERPSSASNRPRNDAFTILLAGKLNKAGITVRAIEGIAGIGCVTGSEQTQAADSPADILIEHQGMPFRIECKRPQSKQAIEVRTRAARKQLEKYSVAGIIAIDCSAAIRPLEKVLETYSEEAAIGFLNQKLIEEVKPEVEGQLDTSVAGAILYARVPVQTQVEVSAILGADGLPVPKFRQDTASTLIFLGNGASPHQKFFKSIQECFVLLGR